VFFFNSGQKVDMWKPSGGEQVRKRRKREKNEKKEFGEVQEVSER